MADREIVVVVANALKNALVSFDRGYEAAALDFWKKAWDRMPKEDWIFLFTMDRNSCTRADVAQVLCKLMVQYNLYLS